jgi:Uma2 family endonuclease
MSTTTKTFVTPEEYLALERVSERKSEYRAGEIFDMSCASEPHILISVNVLASLHHQLRKRPCKVYPGDLRIKVSAAGLYTYPDVSVLCGEAVLDDNQKDTLTNPTVIIEVLSPSTEAYDRGQKFEYYRKLESLAEYVLVSQDKRHIEIFTRQNDGRWLLTETTHGVARLRSIKCRLALNDVYDKVEIPGAN